MNESVGGRREDGGLTIFVPEIDACGRSLDQALEVDGDAEGCADHLQLCPHGGGN